MRTRLPRLVLTTSLAGALALGMAACDDTGEGLQDDTEDNLEDAEDAVDDGDGAEEDG